LKVDRKAIKSRLKELVGIILITQSRYSIGTSVCQSSSVGKKKSMNERLTPTIAELNDYNVQMAIVIFNRIGKSLNLSTNRKASV